MLYFLIPLSFDKNLDHTVGRMLCERRIKNVKDLLKGTRFFAKDWEKLKERSPKGARKISRKTAKNAHKDVGKDGKIDALGTVFRGT